MKEKFLFFFHERTQGASFAYFSLANERREQIRLRWFTTKRTEQQANVPIRLFEVRAGREAVRGFTLIELMVVLAIIVVITTVVMTNQNSFNKTLVLSNTAYDIALTLRSAQTYGLSSRAASISASTGYGVHIPSVPSGSFTFFADAYPIPSTLSVCHPTSDASLPDAKPGDCVYEPAQGEKVIDYTLGNGITISDFCAYALGSWTCAQGGGLSSLDIVFTRPNPDPFMSTNGSYSATFPVTAACIKITSPQGGAHFISIGASGQIIANAVSCP